MNKYVLIIIILFILYIVVLEVKKRWIYKPSGYSGERYQIFYQKASKFGKLNEFFVPTADEKNINGLIISSSSPKYLLFCPSGEGNMTDLLPYVELLSPFVNIILFDYTSFGRSEGYLPNETIVKENVLAVWNYLTQDLEIYPDEITIMGDSLGAAVAIWLTGFLAHTYSVEPSGLIVQSAFSSLKDMVSNIPIVNISKIFIRDEYNSYEHVKLIGKGTPVLFMHSKDAVNIPYIHGLKLYYNLLAERKTRTNNVHFFTGYGEKIIKDQKYTSLIKKFIS